MASITIVTLVANVCMIVAIIRVKRSPTHYPLSSLVIADFLVGFVVLPIAAARELFIFQLPRIVCTIWSTMDVLCCTASILSLCALGWERWSGITEPLGRARRAKKAKLLSCIVWPISSVVALPAAIIPAPRHFHAIELPKACSVNTNVGYVFFSICSSFYIPAGMMMVMYWYITQALAAPPVIRVHRGRNPYPETQNVLPERGDINKTPEQNPNKDNSENIQSTHATPKRTRLTIPGISKLKLPSPLKSPRFMSGHITRQRRASLTITMMMSLFLVCWSPFFLMLPLDSIFDCVPDSAWQWCTWLGYLNSALNPLVYSARSPSVQRALRSSFSSSSSGNRIPLALRQTDV